MTRTNFVTSSDGVAFAVVTSARTEGQLTQAGIAEAAYARTRTAAELDLHGDYQRVKSMEYYFSAPRISSPLDRRAAFRVIKGGKS